MKEVYGYIYKIRNTVNNKLYFGQTTLDFGGRYGYNLLKNTHNNHLQSSIIHYGEDKFEIVEKFDVAHTKEELDLLEDMYIKMYNTINTNYGYNKKYGGGNGHHTQRTKDKISETLTGENNPFYGQHHTEETKEKLRQANTGKQTWLGKTHTEESKQKISETKTGTHVGGDNPRARKVICLNTGQVFACAKDGAVWGGRTNCKNAGSPVIMCCNGKRKSSGKHPITGEKLRWMYYDKWLELNN